MSTVTGLTAEKMQELIDGLDASINTLETSIIPIDVRTQKLAVASGNMTLTLTPSTKTFIIDIAGEVFTFEQAALGIPQFSVGDISSGKAAFISDEKIEMADGAGALIEMSPVGITFNEHADPAAPSTNYVIVYAKDVGGKTALMARFHTGAVQQIAIEP